MAASADPSRIALLEDQIRELQTVYAQLASYAKDLNRTYLELRLRLQQMTTLSALATRLARARTVDAATRACVEGVHELFPDSDGALYLQDRHETLKLAAQRPNELDTSHRIFDALASAALRGDEPAQQRDPSAKPSRDVVSVALRARGKAFGALVVSREQSFDEDDVRIIDLLGNNAAVTISNARLYQQTRHLAITDPLTGLPNLRHFRSTLTQEIQKAKRFKYPIAVIMADIDHFKAYNDAFGHPKGNVALRKIAQAILQNLRQTDVVARYGGEEFSVILPGCDRLALVQVAEKVRLAVECLPLPWARPRAPTTLTMSIGCAWEDAAYTDADTLVASADEALYTAKAMGRNRSYLRPD